MIKLSALAFALAVTAHAGTPCPIDFPDSAGKIVEKKDDYVIRLIESAKGGPKTAEARFLVAASREKCWKTITDFEHYPEFMPNITSAKLEKHTFDYDTYSFTLKAALWDIGYTIKLTPAKTDSAWILAWTYLRGDLKSTTGSWKIIECASKPGTLLVCYRVRVDAGKLVPAWISSHLTTKSIPGLIEAVRKRAGWGKGGEGKRHEARG